MSVNSTCMSTLHVIILCLNVNCALVTRPKVRGHQKDSSLGENKYLQ